MTTSRDVATVEIEASDLPLCCPNPRMPLWSSHPRVYLDATATGAARCPYCGTAYQLRSGPVTGGGH
jgi:uncharacterized Zn-finger protein